MSKRWGSSGIFLSLALINPSVFADDESIVTSDAVVAIDAESTATGGDEEASIGERENNPNAARRSGRRRGFGGPPEEIRERIEELRKSGDREGIRKLFQEARADRGRPGGPPWARRGRPENVSPRTQRGNRPDKGRETRADRNRGRRPEADRRGRGERERRESGARRRGGDRDEFARRGGPDRGQRAERGRRDGKGREARSGRGRGSRSEFARRGGPRRPNGPGRGMSHRGQRSFGPPPWVAMMHGNSGPAFAGPAKASKELRELREQVQELTKLVEKLVAQKSAE